MPLRHRLVLLAAGTVGVTVLPASVVGYVALRAELRGQIDDALNAQARRSRQPQTATPCPGPWTATGCPSPRIRATRSR